MGESRRQEGGVESQQLARVAPGHAQLHIHYHPAPEASGLLATERGISSAYQLVFANLYVPFLWPTTWVIPSKLLFSGSMVMMSSA